jgi:hypothetical protein
VYATCLELFLNIGFYFLKFSECFVMWMIIIDMESALALNRQENVMEDSCGYVYLLGMILSLRFYCF